MNTDQLRTALSDEATPTGIDLGAVRRRARRQHRWTAAAAAFAVVAVALAVVLPLRATRATAPPVHPPTSATADCPRSFPRDLHNSGPGLDEHLVPMSVDSIVGCEYHNGYLTRQPPPPAIAMYLTGSHTLAADPSRGLVENLERMAPQPRAGCSSDVPSALLLVTGGGRTVSLRVELAGCGLVTNGRTTRYGGEPMTTALASWLTNTPPRLACPLTFDAAVRGPLVGKPQEHILRFVPDRLIACRYGPMPGQLLTPDWTHEFDGPDARAFMDIVDGAIEFSPVPCALPAGPYYQFVVVVAGEGKQSVLTGANNGCTTLGNDRRVVGVDWDRLLTLDH